MSRRLFVAYELPSNLKSDLRILQYSIKQHFPQRGINWVNPNNMHITMAFLGNVKDSSIENIKKAMNTLSYSSVKIELNSYKFFMRQDIPTVFYISVLQGEMLTDYTNKLRAIFNAHNISFDRKPFKSHITIARLKEPQIAKEFYEYVNTKLDNISSGEYTIKRIVLYESILGNGGPKYIEIYSI